MSRYKDSIRPFVAGILVLALLVVAAIGVSALANSSPKSGTTALNPGIGSNISGHSADSSLGTAEDANGSPDANESTTPSASAATPVDANIDCVDDNSGQYIMGCVLLPGNGDLSITAAAYNGAQGTAEAKTLAFCKAMSQAIGGPAYKWWITQNPDGTSVPTSCVMREADDRDGVPGWAVNLPKGTNSHIWLYDPNQPNNSHVTVTAVGDDNAIVDGDLLVSRMTIYLVDGAYSASHRGQWTFGELSGSDKDSSCGWVNIGTSVDMSSCSSSGTPGGSTCTVAQIKDALGLNGTSPWEAVGTNGAHYGGSKGGDQVSFNIPSGYSVDSPSGNGQTKGKVTATQFTAYCVG